MRVVKVERSDLQLMIDEVNQPLLVADGHRRTSEGVAIELFARKTK